jgi:hypothetical protein
LIFTGSRAAEPVRELEQAELVQATWPWGRGLSVTFTRTFAHLSPNLFRERLAV